MNKSSTSRKEEDELARKNDNALDTSSTSSGDMADKAVIDNIMPVFTEDDTESTTTIGTAILSSNDTEYYTINASGTTYTTDTNDVIDTLYAAEEMLRGTR